MTESNSEVAEHRYNFYRDGWRTMVMVLPIVVLGFVAMTIAFAWAMSRTPEPRYFAVEQGRIVPLVPVSNPYIRPGDLNQWVARAVMEAYMIDFQNFKTRIEENAKYFTPEGFADYKRQLESSGRMKMIMDGWLVGSATITGAPVIVKEGLAGGRYTWTLRMPIVVSYVSKTVRIPPQNLTLTITVVRMPTHENPYGIGISQIIERN